MPSLCGPSPTSGRGEVGGAQPGAAVLHGGRGEFCLCLGDGAVEGVALDGVAASFADEGGELVDGEHLG